jgi:flagellar hook-length control protein FliK
VGINTNALTMGGSMTAKPSFQPRSSDSASGPVTDDHTLDSDPGANRTSGATGKAATGDAGATGSSNSTVAGSGKTGPSAQTRSAQAGQSPGAARSRTRASAATGSQATPTSQDTADDAGTDFGTVLATALGGSGAGTTDAATSTATPSGSGNATSTANAAQPTTAPVDAVAWIAQVMMTPGAAQAATTPANVAANTAAGGRIATAAGAAAGTAAGAATGTAAGAATVTAATAETVAGENAAAAGQSAANSAGAGRSGVDTDPLAQTTAQNSAQTVQTSDAQAAASPAAIGAANLNALADVQKLISGLTGAGVDADADDGTVTGTPTTHATTDGAGSTDAAQAAAALQSSSLTRAGASLGTTTLSIQAAVGSAGFADEVSSRVTSLAQSGITQAQLQLNPADLGPVQVHITMQSGQASVWFGASHADTRAALEQSLPRLREMFAGAGLPLTDSGVFREPPQQQQAQSLPASSIPRTMTSETAATTSVTQVANIRLSLLDTYA